MLKTTAHSVIVAKEALVETVRAATSSLCGPVPGRESTGVSANDECVKLNDNISHGPMAGLLQDTRRSATQNACSPMGVTHIRFLRTYRRRGAARRADTRQGRHVRPRNAGRYGPEAGPEVPKCTKVPSVMCGERRRIGDGSPRERAMFGKIVLPLLLALPDESHWRGMME